jgi:hypothetical protein
MVYCDSVRTFAVLDALMARYDVDECVIERLEELLQSLDERLSLLSAAETEAQERAAASERALLGAERTALIDDIMRHKVALLRSVAKAGCWCKEHGLVGLEPHERVRKPVQGIAPGDISGGLQARERLPCPGDFVVARPGRLAVCVPMRIILGYPIADIDERHMEPRGRGACRHGVGDRR